MIVGKSFVSLGRARECERELGGQQLPTVSNYCFFFSAGTDWNGKIIWRRTRGPRTTPRLLKKKNGVTRKFCTTWLKRGKTLPLGYILQRLSQPKNIRIRNELSLSFGQLSITLSRVLTLVNSHRLSFSFDQGFTPATGENLMPRGFFSAVLTVAVILADTVGGRGLWFRNKESPQWQVLVKTTLTV